MPHPLLLLHPLAAVAASAGCCCCIRWLLLLHPLQLQLPHPLQLQLQLQLPLRPQLQARASATGAAAAAGAGKVRNTRLATSYNPDFESTESNSEGNSLGCAPDEWGMAQEGRKRGRLEDATGEVIGALIEVHWDCGYRLDLVVGGSVLLQLKAVERLLPIHEAQVVTCLRLSQLQVGLLVNFNVTV